MAEKTQKEHQKKFYELIDHIKVAMLTSTESDGSLRARPMSVFTREGDEALYCLTRSGSHKTLEIADNAVVNLAFAKPGSQEFVSATGKAIVSRDRKLIDELWSEPARAFFPEGKDDPAMVAIKIDLDYGEYWDAPSATMTLAYGWLRAATTGKSAEDLGEEGKVRSVG